MMVRWHTSRRCIGFLIVLVPWLVAGESAATEQKRQQSVHHRTQRGSAHHPKAPQSRKKARTPPSVPASAPRPLPEKREEVETIEPINVAPATGDQPLSSEATTQPAAANEPSSWLRTLGRLHAAAVHMPIAWTLLWALAEILVSTTGAHAIGTATLPLGVLTCLSFLPSLASGWLRLGELSLQPGYDVSDGVVHRNLMLATYAVVLVALLLRLICTFFSFGWLRRIYLVTLFAALIITGYGAHLGGRLVYGDTFLPF